MKKSPYTTIMYLMTFLIMMGVVFGGSISTVNAEQTMTKIEGVLIEGSEKQQEKQQEENIPQPDYQLILHSDNNLTKNVNTISKIPKLGDDSDAITIFAGVLIIVTLIIWKSGVLKIAVSKKVLLGLVTMLLVLSHPLVSKAKPTSTVIGELSPGVFTMTKPTDISFKTVLTTGKKQTVDLKDITTNVTDYRGINEGWQLTIKSPNYDQYRENFSIVINQKSITNNSQVVVEKRQKTMSQKVVLDDTKVEIVGTALAGSYIANLEWNLQPNTQKKIEE
ncbi:hypothetical protein [Brochothrix thermosphacta]|uniref:Uncharacterized protein n=1 Tax=Brochothrix thermosphacta TaxID=2756 RepID=A0A1D2L2K4_BROTH|nr:hypothetical protein [Brochothrix thermosphacta]ATF25654.1 hypothetical protein CNY62_04185 [Brochothrix thermosphacta]ATH84998.1 hypothetical protein CPF12_03810 [Brochothrix thermosphacta]MPQ29592.1 hypothetical protein [Brochothrix thermosphacta]ODJ64050.1 hypothetical protein BFR36_11010 [Brochothrix thermosphacta]ODJ70013.1 hypothetical protein BFR45_11195 [Brochothrix thermosphacta]